MQHTHMDRASRLVATALALLSIAGAAAGASAQASSSTSRADAVFDVAALDTFVEAQMRQARIPGVALAVIKEGQVLAMRGYGRADPSGHPVTPQTPFIMGSNAKTFTALAVMQLVEAGQVEFDAPVQRYIPWFRMGDTDASARITIRHLLNQTSGIANADGLVGIWWTDTDAGALERYVRSWPTGR